VNRKKRKTPPVPAKVAWEAIPVNEHHSKREDSGYVRKLEIHYIVLLPKRYQFKICDKVVDY
jgi:hypothetical protein